MAISTFVLLGIVALMIWFILKWFCGAISNGKNEVKANAYLAKKYDDDRVGR